MGYQILMLEASNEYQNNRWLAYDQRFRQLAASQPSCKWSITDSTLWSLAFTGQAKVNRCKHCFSLFHQSIDCEFAQVQPPAHMTKRIKLQATDDSFAINGMNNTLRDAFSQTAVMNMCVITVPLIRL